jgi:flagellar basal-body rod protein FlgB
MEPIHLFDMVSRVNHWLTARQLAIAENIANANTLGFRAQDVMPFESVLQSTSLAMSRTQAQHLDYGPTPTAVAELRADEPWEMLVSGNTVSLDKEMIKAGEVNRSFALNTSVIKAFHRMLLASSKG